MTQPDGGFPSDAANFGSLAAFAAMTQADWMASLTAAEHDRWNKSLTGLFGNMPAGQNFLLTLLSELSKRLLGLDPTTWFASLNDAWNSLETWAASVWEKSAEQWQAIGVQLNALWTLVTSGPVSAAQWAVWWSNFLLALGLAPADAAAIANFLSGNYDAAKQAKAWWDQFLAALGWTNGAQAAGQITGNTSNISTQNTWLTQLGQIVNGQVVTAINASVQQFKDWWNSNLGPTAVKARADQNAAWAARKSQNDQILGDWFGSTYPLGSPSDTAATLVGGKRTKWGAWNDNLKIVGEQLGIVTPTAPLVDIGSFAQATQTQVISNESTLATVQAKVDALTVDGAVAGRKYISSASGGASAIWGANWSTTVTNGNVAAKSELDLFSMTLANSSSVDLAVDGVYNGGQALTDDVIVSLVFYDAAKAMAGGDGPHNTLKARRNSAGTAYIFARVFYNTITLGYCVGGAETVWATYTGVAIPAGSLVELQCGSTTNHRQYQVRVNGTVVGSTYTEVGTSSQMGAAYRYGGQQMVASHGTFNDVFQPARVRQFSLRDSNAQASTYGTSARWYRNTTTPKNFTGSNSVFPFTSDVFNAVDYCSADLSLQPGGVVFYTPGRYMLGFAARYSAAQTGGQAVALLRNTASGASIYEEGTYVGAAAMVGIEGHFEFNAIGDGDATEAWFVGMDLPGTGRNVNVIGEGVGYQTWMTVTRIG